MRKTIQNLMRGCSLVLILSVEVSSQIKTLRPKFSDYPVEQVYIGKAASPKLTKDQRYFRTMIRRGAKAQVEFAGHYTVPRWGCGTSCNVFAVVDSVTGAVYDGFGVTELPFAWQDQHNGNAPERMESNPHSRLLKINGCPNERDCGFYDFLIVDGKGLQLLRKKLLPKDFQY